MRLSVELMDDYTLIKSRKNFDADLALEARDVFNEVIEHVDRNVVLDLSLSHHIDASGIGAISFLYKRLKSLGFNLEIVGMNDEAMQLVHSLYVSDVIPCRPASALNAEEHPPLFSTKNK